MSDKPNNQLPIIIGAVVALVLIVGGVAYAFSMNRPADDNSMMGQNGNSIMSDPNATVSVGGAMMYKNKDIISNVSTAPNLTTLVTAVKAADLVSTLSSPGPFTVFGPDNDAFAKLPSGTVETLVKPENKAKLSGILTYHVVAGKMLSTDLKDGQTLTTVNGATLKVSKSGNAVMVNGAMIKTADVLQSNGVAHVIDTVLMPPADSTDMMDDKMTASVMVGGSAMFPTKDIITNVSTAPNLTTLVTAVTAADLVATLQGPGPFTVFGPDNSAFAKLPAGTVDTLVKPENKTTLTNILTYHVVAGKYASTDLVDSQKLKTVQGQELTVKKVGATVMIMDMSGNAATILTPDVFQSNGVAHVIDTVLMPKS